MFGLLGGLLGGLGGLGAAGGLSNLLGVINGIGGTIGGIGGLISQFQTNSTRKKLTDRLIRQFDETSAANRAPIADVPQAPRRDPSALYGLTDLLNQSKQT
jgi:predicted lipid-binding transport protein (Tim44 family)